MNFMAALFMLPYLKTNYCNVVFYRKDRFLPNTEVPQLYISSFWCYKQRHHVVMQCELHVICDYYNNYYQVINHKGN